MQTGEFNGRIALIGDTQMVFFFGSLARVALESTERRRFFPNKLSCFSVESFMFLPKSTESYESLFGADKLDKVVKKQQNFMLLKKEN